jgi:hypothetical protein
LSLLAIAAPEHRQAVVTIGTEWQRDSDPEHDPVEAEAEGLVFLGREDGIKEDPAEGDLGSPLVAERIIDDDPDDPTGDQMGQDQCGQDEAQVVPLPDGGMEDCVGGVMMPLGGQPGSEPDLADGTWPLTDDPAGEQRLERLEDLGMEAVLERHYQGGERGDKLRHGAGLRAARCLESSSNPRIPSPSEFARFLAVAPLTFVVRKTSQMRSSIKTGILAERVMMR